MSIEHYYCIIPAAGSGVRFASSVPKQYVSVCDRTLIEHTLIKFCNYPRIKKIIVPVAPDDTFFSSLEIAHHEKILVVTGGCSRPESVLCALKRLATLGANDQDWILIHDAVRPCISTQDIKKLIAEVGSHEVGGFLGITVRDTLKRISPNAGILETVARNDYIQAQSPQLFRKHVLERAYALAMQSTKEHLEKFTDEASLIEAMGLQPKVVLGSAQNIKLTYSEDLFLIEQILRKDEGSENDKNWSRI